MNVEFWVTSIVVTATPGTGALFTIAAGLARGARWGVIAAAGCTLGIVPHLALALLEAAAVLAASPIAFEAIKWLGVAYLLYLAWGSWRQSGAFTPQPGDRAATVRRTIGSAALVNLLNPKLTLFFFVFLPLFVDPAGDGAVFDLARLQGLDRPRQSQCRVGTVADDQSRRPRDEPVLRERVHGDSLAGSAGSQLRVVEVIRKSHDEVQSGGDTLDRAARQVPPDRLDRGIASLPVPPTQGAQVLLQYAGVDQVGEGELGQCRRAEVEVTRSGTRVGLVEGGP